MSSRKSIIEFSYHDDDDTGIYKVGEVDFGYGQELSDYLKTYGKAEIIKMLRWFADAIDRGEIK